MNKNATLWLVLALLCVVPVLAASFQSGGGLSVVYPKSEAFVSGENVSLSFYVYNSSGFRLENASAVCSFSLFNSNNSFCNFIVLFFIIIGTFSV
jgi:hypothetical protein